MESDRRWRVGPRDITVEDVILVSLHHVTQGNWQPQLRLRRVPPGLQATTGDPDSMMNSWVSQEAHALHRIDSQGSSDEESHQTKIGLQTATGPDPMMNSWWPQGTSADTVAHAPHRIGLWGSSHGEPSQTEIGLQTTTGPDPTISSWASQEMFFDTAPYTPGSDSFHTLQEIDPYGSGGCEEHSQTRRATETMS